MSTITIQTVNHVANLARLEFNEEEKKKLADQLGRILDYIEKLNELDTEKIGPTSHVIPVKNVFRSDSPNPSLSRKDALANVPSQVGGLFEVPKIIE
jgi:aspartyl-tRNA(Asn)/glutamyl-tRNA(Gln) amidotransferase subunit C